MVTATVSVPAVLQDDGLTLRLDAKLSLPPGRVSVTIQPETPVTGQTALEVLARIHREQQDRGQIPKTAAEIDAEIAEIRDDEGYEQRWREIWSNTRLGGAPEE